VGDVTFIRTLGHTFTCSAQGGGDFGGYLGNMSGTPNGTYFTTDGNTVYLVRHGYYMVSANLGNFHEYASNGNFGWGQVQSYLEVGGVGNFGADPPIALSSDADEYNRGGYGWGFAGVGPFFSSAASGAKSCRIRVNSSGGEGNPLWLGRISVQYLGPIA
jgi:hypothetical protein